MKSFCQILLAGFVIALVCGCATTTSVSPRKLAYFLKHGDYSDISSISLALSEQFASPSRAAGNADIAYVPVKSSAVESVRVTVARPIDERSRYDQVRDGNRIAITFSPIVCVPLREVEAQMGEVARRETYSVHVQGQTGGYLRDMPGPLEMFIWLRTEKLPWISPDLLMPASTWLRIRCATTPDDGCIRHLDAELTTRVS